LIDRNHRNQIPLLQLGKRRRNIDPGGAPGKRIPDDKCAPVQVGQQGRGRLEIQTQILVALEIKEDYVPAGDARVRMLADCILTRHLKTAVTDDWGRREESATASHEGGRVFTVACGVTSMWLSPDRRAVKFEEAAWGSLRLFRSLTELNDHAHFS